MKYIKRILIFFLCFTLLFTSCNLPDPITTQDSTPDKQYITVNMDSTIFSGPDEVFEPLGMLAAGQSAEFLGTNIDGDFYLILDPGNSENQVWIKSEFVTLEKPMKGVKIFTPAPSPTVLLTTVVPTVEEPGCPTPIGGGPTPISCTEEDPAPGSGCPTPVGGGPTPITCTTLVPSSPDSGCPTPIGGGPTPITCTTLVPPSPGSGCPTPIGGGPTPVTCDGSSGSGSSGSGCPTPIGGGPTPVTCDGSSGSGSSGSGCPTPIGGGPTPVTCDGSSGSGSSGSGCPTPIGGGPTPITCLY
ncbi:MAG: hypothetical protein JEZ00_13790 [Anaerolineaceae bacterium]|nr:hypothetical protein [Anaerolineaceae bacterium]